LNHKGLVKDPEKQVRQNVGEEKYEADKIKGRDIGRHSLPKHEGRSAPTSHVEESEDNEEGVENVVKPREVISEIYVVIFKKIPFYPVIRR
jgi:hypothetical protein